MFSEKQFRKWRKRQPAVEEQDQARARAEIGSEIDAALVDIRARAEAERTTQQFRHAYRHRDQLRAAEQLQKTR